MTTPMNKFRLKILALLAGLCPFTALGFSMQAAAPSLVMVTPPTVEGPGAKITFMFDQIMSTAAIDITWEGAQIDPAKFQNKWVDSMMGFPIPAFSLESAYQGGLPPGVTVKYTLNKNNSGRMKSADGQPLPEISGTFVSPGTPGGDTGGGDPCQPTSSTNLASATISLTKQINYRQSGGGDPVFDPANPAMVMGAIMSTTNTLPQTPASARLIKPDGSMVELVKMSFEIPEMPGIPGFPMPSLPTSFYLSTAAAPDIEFPTFTSEAALQAAYPNGVYNLLIGLSSGGERAVSLPLSPSPEPPAPKILNYAALQNFNVSAPLVVQWNAFAGAAAMDSIYLEIRTKENQVVFFAPNPCKSIELEATDTQISIPAGTFQPATPYLLRLSFHKSTHFGENTLEGFKEFTALEKVTELSIGAPDQAGGKNELRFSGIEILDGGTVKLTVEGTIASDATPAAVEGSTDLRNWQPVATVLKSALELGGGRTEVLDTLPGATPTPQKFYRFGEQ